MKENLFFQLLKTGNIRFDEGRLIILNAFQIIFPVSVFLRLYRLLLKNSSKKTKTILKELGKYQFDQSLKRYKKLLKIEKITIEKVIDFFAKHASLMGFGKFNLIKFQKKPFYVVLTNNNNPIAIEYRILYGTSKHPIDYYFSGLLEAAYSRLFNKKLKCIETLCIGKGDKVCQFEITEIKD